MRYLLIFLCLIELHACSPERSSPVGQLHEFETIALITQGDIALISETARWLHLQLSPSSDREIARLRRLDDHTELTLLVAGHASGPVRLRDLLDNDEMRLPRNDWAGDSLAIPLNRLRAVTASEGRVLVEIGVASPVAEFSEAEIRRVSPDEGRATFDLNSTVQTNEELLLTAGGLVLARGGSLTLEGDELHASGIRRDVLERWAEGG